MPVCSGQGPRTCAARPAAPNCSPGIIAEVHYERRAHLLPEDLRDPALRTGTRRAGRGPGSDPRDAKTAPRAPGDTLRTSVSSSRRLSQDPKPLDLGTPGPAPAASDPDRRGWRHSGTRSHPAPCCAIPAPSPGPPCCRRSPRGSVYFLPAADPPDQTGSTTSQSSPGRGVPGTRHWRREEGGPRCGGGTDWAA